MSDDTPILSLPLLVASQAQKHVTHNEALRLLDILVQLTVLDRDRTTPPPLPAEGDRYIIAANPAGDWAGQGGKIAAFWGGVWVFITPKNGWLARLVDENRTLVYRDGGWEPDFAQIGADVLGINTTADATNRLAVSSPATLFTHQGAGHQVKLNKASATDTASLLFQNGFSGRAEIGLNGGDDLSVKVSADGASFATALTVDRATGLVGLPAGVAINGPVTGTAITQGTTDATMGRITRVGDFGLGVTGDATAIADLADFTLPTGFYRVDAATLGQPVAGQEGVVQILRHSSGRLTQRLTYNAEASASAGITFVRSRNGTTGTWAAWWQHYSQGNLVGSVSQLAGKPTGAVIERGANANGEFIRWADGTQLCLRSSLISTTLAGGGYTETAWTFPASFASGNVWIVTPVVRSSATATAREFAARYLRAAAGWTTLATSVTVGMANSHASTAATSIVDVTAFGRWF